jgi:membrane protein required for colicin V production
MVSWNAFDWLLVAILAWSTLSALRRGLIRVLCSLAGLVAGFALADWKYKAFGLWLAHGFQWIRPLHTATIVSFVLIVVAVTVAASVIGGFFHKAVSAVGLGLLNRLAGAAFGAARGCLAGAALVTLIAAFSPRSEAIRRSQLSGYFLAGAHAVCFFLPADFQVQVSSGSTRLQRNASGWIGPR